MHILKLKIGIATNLWELQNRAEKMPQVPQKKSHKTV